MAETSRTGKSIRVLISNYMSRIVDIALSFITRSVFIYFLGVEYLGLNGLYASVLSVLSLAELGVGNAITFHLYKPIQERDEEHIKELVDFYKKCYGIIGTVIFLVGLVIMPFLPIIVNFETKVTINLYVVYILYLFNTVSSYWFFAYYRTTIYAHQRQDVVYNIEIVYKIFSSVVCTIGIIFTSNYYLYLLLQIGSTFVKNVMIRNRALKMFPYLKNRSIKKLAQSEIKQIMKDMYSIMYTRISSMLSSSFDSVIVSAFVSTTMVGYISNYTLIQTSVLGFTNAVIGATTAGIGNLVAEGNREKQYKVYKQLDFINFYLIYFSCVCIPALATPFIKLWIGESYTVNSAIIYCIVFNSSIYYSLNVTWAFKDGMGLFKYGRSAQMIQGVSNVILSVLLCKYFGAVGVYFASLITNIIITWPVYTYNLYKHGFKMKCGERVKRAIGRIGFTVLMVFILQSICGFFTNINWTNFIIMVIICIVVSNFAFILLFHRAEEWGELKIRITNMFKGKMIHK